jgi:hypothetical protein
MSHAPLHPDTRNLLAREILKAREAAEAGAKASLAALRVGEVSPAEGMSAAERSLRNRLRANGRQLGDNLLSDGKQELGYLVEEIAYQHWHRMLFARFLAENGLLREDQGDQPIDLAECEALANAEGLDIWAYAARCAQKMLPGVFRLDDPKLELRLDTPKQLELNVILKALPSQVFTATDALGWVYQYWQAKRKDEVNASGVKIGAKELSPVTQLFTEDYMVDFLLHNTLGAWWAGKMGPIEAATEEEARAKAGLSSKNGLPAIIWTYLRFVQDAETKKWTPAGGTFEGWPKKAKEITFLDPCMGSGHFPVFALPILARMRMEEEGGTPQENVHGVLKDQIHGLELDQRCCQIGAFNLALTAWKLAGLQHLPALNVACCGIAPRAKLTDWVKLAGGDEKLKASMTTLYELFEEAPVLGSLINPRAGKEDLLVASFDDIKPKLEAALAVDMPDGASGEIAVTARGLAVAAEILSSKYTLIATNVPFLGRLKQDEKLRRFCENTYPQAKADLATCFVQRCLDFSDNAGSTALVTPQIWIFLKTYKNLRVSLLRDYKWNMVAKLGTKAFETIAGEVVNVALHIISRIMPPQASFICGIDVGNLSEPGHKAKELSAGYATMVSQSEQSGNPNAAIMFSSPKGHALLEEYASSIQGASTLDIEMFRLNFWEVFPGDVWILHQSTPSGGSAYDGLQYVSIHRNAGGRFEKLALELKEEGRLGGAWSGEPAWGKRGVACAWMGSLPAALYLGAVYDNSIAAIIPKNEADLAAIWAFCSSPSYLEEVRKVNQKSQVANATLVQVPFDVEHWRRVACEKYPNGLPPPFSSDPTQWIFNGNPYKSDNPLQVAVARLLCYQWPRQTGSSLPDCAALGPDGIEKHADDDGIVALSPINREEAAAARLRALLKDAYGAEWQDGVTERQLLSDAGHGAATIEEWLRDSFFEEHCKLFHHRPFIWHIWDGEKDGFHVLVNYHRLAAGNGDGTRLLQKLATTYLGDWIARCNQEVVADKPGAARRLKAAQDLQVDLRKILEGEAPNDVFVRWKPLHEQAIGWAPDINDGVRLNIRPFLTVRDVGKKGAGLLRFKPNVKWDKDRGKEPQRPKSEFPWFWSCDPESNPQHATDFSGGSTFTGERWNELHYTLAAKRAARASRT